jgi:prepilin-type N-terminal cleavage/methylation domain-containing protein
MNSSDNDYTPASSPKVFPEFGFAAERHGSRFTIHYSRVKGFTLTELMIVLGIIVVLSIVTIPAISSRSGSNQMTKAADTVKGVLDKARAYAQANNTYTWVGFFEEDASKPSTDPPSTGNGRLVMAIVASTDGTNLGADVSSNVTGTNNYLDATRLIQIGTLVKIDNVHPPLFVIPNPPPDCSTVDCTTFDNRPPIQNDGGSTGYNASRFGELNAAAPNTAPYDTTNGGLTKFPFKCPIVKSKDLPQYTFQRTMRFSPTGENRINSTFDVRALLEIGLLQSRGATVPAPNPSAGIYPGNVVAVQIGGSDGIVKIYKR